MAADPPAGPSVTHDAVDCIVAGRYPLFPACFEPAGEVARGRVYFQVEGTAAWFFVEMKPAPPCWAGVLPKPTRALVNRRVRYYVEAITRSLGSARTAEYAPLVVASARDCALPKVAAFAPAGPPAVQPFLPGGFALGGFPTTLVVVGAGVTTGAGIIVAHPRDPTPQPTPTPVAPPAPSPPPTPPADPNPTPTPMPKPTPAPSPTPTPSATPTPSPDPTPSPTPSPGPSALAATCSASPPAGVAPLSVVLAASAQGGTGAYTFAWIFGDGQTSALANPTHVYTGAGDYAPTVQVTSGPERVTCTTAVSVSAAPAQTFPLAVSRLGSGAGLVQSAPAGIDCGGTCAASYAQGTVVSLTAQADAGSIFAGWSGACTGAGACSVTMDAARTVSARFDLRSFTLSVTKTPVGSILGTVTSAPAGVSCGLLCATTSAQFPYGTVVTLTAQAILTASFSGWRGDCSGTGACVVTMDADKSVTADFALLGLGTSEAERAGPPPGPRGELDLGLLRTSLRVPKGRGEVTMDGRVLVVVGEGEASVGVRAHPGDNLVEAWSRLETSGGLWRFSFPTASLEGIVVLSGDAVLTTPDSVSFRVSGRAGERLSFVLRVRGPGGASSP